MNVQLTARQQQVLRIITEQYINHAAPVGSNSICDGFLVPLSSATVRNECLLLERLQLLEKTHINSGRVPSVAGYRYYVKHLMAIDDSDLSRQIKVKLQDIFDQRFCSVRQILNQASLVISEMMKVATVVTTNQSVDTELVLNQLQLIPLSAGKALVVFVLNRDQIKNKIFDVTGVQVDNLRLAIDIFNARLRGTKVSELLAKMKLVKMILAQQIHHYEQILLQFTHAFINIGLLKTDRFGMKYILQNPALHAVKINQLLNVVNMVSPLTYFTNHWSSSGLTPVMMRFGSDLPGTSPARRQVMDRIAVVSKSFMSWDQTNQATLSLIGDRRMAYGQIYNILN